MSNKEALDTLTILSLIYCVAIIVVFSVNIYWTIKLYFCNKTTNNTKLIPFQWLRVFELGVYFAVIGVMIYIGISSLQNGLVVLAVFGVWLVRPLILLLGTILLIRTRLKFLEENKRGC